MRIVVVDDDNKKRRLKWSYLVVPLILFLVVLSVIGFTRDCPECDTTADCPRCPPCETCECPEPDCPNLRVDCSKCPPKNLVYYICNNGSLVESPQDCKTKFDKINISSPYQNTKWDVTLGIDNIEYEMDEGDFGHITKIQYTILNNKEVTIIPKIAVNIYDVNSSSAAKSFVHKLFLINETLEAGAWMKRTEYTRISFNGRNQTVKLVLIDTIPDPDDNVVMAAMQINE